MQKRTIKIRLKYDHKADVLLWNLSDKPIDYASEFGDVIVHFTKNDEPVLVEILHAKLAFA